MKRATPSTTKSLRHLAARRFLVSACFAGVALVAAGAFAQASKSDPGATIGGGAFARVLPPAEKIKVLEDELAKETERRGKLEDDLAKRAIENSELTTAVKNASKERASIELRWSETRDRELQLQKANERLREENERIAITVRLSLPLVALVAIGILTMLVLDLPLPAQNRNARARAAHHLGDARGRGAAVPRERTVQRRAQAQPDAAEQAGRAGHRRLVISSARQKCGQHRGRRAAPPAGRVE